MWFWNNKRRQEQKRSIEDATIEVAAAKNAQKKDIEIARKRSQKLTDILVENHFSVRIYVSAGGKLPNKNMKGNL